MIDELMRNSDLLYLIFMRIPTCYCIIVMTYSRCVFVFGLNATRVSGGQGESHVGDREA